MLREKAGVTEALDLAVIGFLTAVNAQGQPQTSPVWFLRVEDDIIVYNRPSSPRLPSVSGNDRVALALRGDAQGLGMLSLEGRASVDENLEPADRVEAYMAKYGEEIEHLGWTPGQFASMYSVGIRIRVTRIRASGIEHVIDAEP